jgi:hypothetical protein
MDVNEFVQIYAVGSSSYDGTYLSSGLSSRYELCMPCGLQVSCSTLCFGLFSGDIPKEIPDFWLFIY